MWNTKTFKGTVFTETVLSQNFNNMRKVIIALMAGVFFTACNNEVEEENARLKERNEELQRQTNAQDSLIQEFVVDFTRIQENLASIREKEQSIEAARGGELEGAQSSREQIITDIESINELLSENRQTIANLNDKLKKYRYEVGNLKNMVSKLNDQVNQKDSQVVVLKENLAAMNFEMESLNRKYQQVSEQSEMRKVRGDSLQEEINTAYYAVGTDDELEENGVIDKTGGFIGIGKTKTLAEDFNRDYFTKIDRTQTQKIPLDVDEKDVKIITNHPTTSYKLNKDGEQVKTLEITDPNAFWKSSRYLVIVID